MTSEEERRCKDAAAALDTDALTTLVESYLNLLRRGWEFSATQNEREEAYQRLQGAKGFIAFTRLYENEAPTPMRVNVP